MEFSRCARVRTRLGRSPVPGFNLAPANNSSRPRGRSLKTQQRALDVEVDVVLDESDYRTSPTAPKIHKWRSQAPRSSTGPTPTGVRAPVFPRKEVIQPQLPLRLPCYDFTPIIDPTFDGSLPCGLGHRLRVLPTFVV